MEIINTGSLRRIQYENTGDVEAVKLFTGIYGVGELITLLSSSFLFIIFQAGP